MVTLTLYFSRSFWGHLVHLHVFRKYQFQKAAPSTVAIPFQPNILHIFPVNVHTEVTSCNFAI